MNTVIMVQVTPERLQEMIEKAVAGAIQQALPKEPKKYTRQEVCDIYHITLPTLHSYVKKGLLKPNKISGRVLFEIEEVENALKSKEVAKYKHTERRIK